MEFLVEYFRQVSRYDWRGVAIELFFIGLVVYWVVEFLEGTRGERLFRGVLFLLVSGVVVLKLVVERFGFERLQFLYNGFLIFVAIVAVAAFQPEIRRALIRIGQPNFLTHPSQRMALTMEEIVDAVVELASDKIGALIVIEKRVALGEFTETGVKLDADISCELLRTIFKPNTPLHDMAVIIRGNKIAAAGVQLPLAESGAVDGVELGSRHRAAIGLSSSSDAGVIVVSEETGVVSISDGGRLVRNVTESQLRKYLNGNINIMALMEEAVKSSPKNRDRV